MMKQLLFILLAITLFASCEKTPEQKAGKLIDIWMTANKPSAVYSKEIHATPLEFTLENQRELDAMRALLDSAIVYSTLTLNKEGLSSALESQEGQIRSMLDGLNDHLKDIAQEKVEAIQEDIDRYEENHRATYKGENGYKVRLNYSLANEDKVLVFHFGEHVKEIIEVEE